MTDADYRQPPDELVICLLLFLYAIGWALAPVIAPPDPPALTYAEAPRR